MVIQKREATNYIQLMTPPVDLPDSGSDAESRCVINRRSVIRLAVVLPPLQVSAYLVMENIPGYGKHFVRKLKYIRLGGSVDRKSF